MTLTIQNFKPIHTKVIQHTLGENFTYELKQPTSIQTKALPGSSNQKAIARHSKHHHVQGTLTYKSLVI